jgi:hypothetical protein
MGDTHIKLKREGEEVMSKRRDRKRTAQASTDLTQRETSTPSLGGELREKVIDANEAKFLQTFATTDPHLALMLALQAFASVDYPRTDKGLTHRGTRAALHSLGARELGGAVGRADGEHPQFGDDVSGERSKARPDR